MQQKIEAMNRLWWSSPNATSDSNLEAEDLKKHVENLKSIIMYASSKYSNHQQINDHDNYNN